MAADDNEGLTRRRSRAPTGSESQTRPPDRARNDGRTLPPDLDEAKRRIGQRIRELRQKANLSVRELADGARVTPAMISQIERGAVAPSLATFLGLAATLRVGVNALFDVATPRGRVVRFSERRSVEYPSLRVRDELISADSRGRLLVVHSHIEANTDSGRELFLHGSQAEFVLVLRGSIDILLASERVHLEEGDTVTFSGDTPHGFANPSDQPAELIWVVTPANQ